MAITKYFTGSGAPRWRVEWRVPGRVKRRKVFRTEREARAFEAEVISAKNRGVVIDPKRGANITVELAYRKWLSSRADLTPKVRRGYEDCWRIAVHEEFGAWPLTAVDRHSVQEWVNTMAGVGPRTKRWRHSVLRMVMQHAVENEWIVKNPCLSTTFPPLTQREHVYLTAQEVERLAELCGTQGDVVLVLAYVGLRWGELMGLRVADVDLTARRVRVRRSITQVGGRLVEGRTKSVSGLRTIPIPRRIHDVLAARVSGRPLGEPAITSPRGALLSRENWVRAVRWNEHREAIGRPTLRIHDLRHTYASLARSAGADLRLLQRTLGHASITVTAHTYADLYDTDLDAVADALDALNSAAKYELPSGKAKQDGPPQAHHEGQTTNDDELDEHESEG
jgi:integrase